MTARMKKIRKWCELCSGSDKDRKLLQEMITNKKLDDQWYKLVKRLFEGAIAIGSFPESRFVLMHEWILQAKYGKPNKEEMEMIDAHLKQMRILTTNLGIDSTDEERKQMKVDYNYHMHMIKEIHEGYYYTIKVQSDG